MESSPHRPRCKNGTRRYPKYKDECLTEEEYKARIVAEKERKNMENRQTKKRKPKDVVEEPSLYNSIVNVVKTLSAPGEKEDVVGEEGKEEREGEVVEEEVLNEDIADKEGEDVGEKVGEKVGEERKKDIVVKDASTKDASTKDASTKEASTKDASTKDASTKDASTKDASTKEASTKEASTKEASTKEASTKEASTKDASTKDARNYLYPSLDDPYFNQKIAHRNEFSSFEYSADITKPLKKTADFICKNPEFELLNHQLFVKSFISQNTPYKSILLYHGLGSGKTCSAIGIAEEMREYMKSIGITQRIIVVASTNVQSNFRLQLFDERRIEEDPITERWTSRSCIGNKLIREINPVGAKMTHEKLVSQAKMIINTSYEFRGYQQFVNNIYEHVYESIDENDPTKEHIEVQNIRRYYNNRLIIIDEVHNCTKEDKRLAKLLLKLATHAENLRFVLLSATPMYNSPREIIWLANLMNINDGRAPIAYDDVFTGEGELKNAVLLRQKLNGYVSYVRGENPYTFPFRIYPDAFAPTNIERSRGQTADIINKLYYTNLEPYQQESYDMVVRSKMGAGEPNINMDDESYGYAELQMPLQALIMTFHRLNATDAFIGKEGMANNMSFVEKNERVGDTYEFRKYNYEYKKGVPRIFHHSELPKYSSKIAEICRCVQKSRGIVIVYTQYIDGGIVAVSLALEEMGFTRYGTSQMASPLFKPGAIDSPPIDATTMMPVDPSAKKFNQAKYMILSGDKYFSQSNAADIKYATSEANMNGELVRVILISRAASEGLDFKYVRQVHILDPWYNLNRIEQIVGRGVRNQSHCGLEFEERNVEIYLHAAVPAAETFSTDLYLYRYAERKARMIGKVTRLLKTVSVDCVLNHAQSDFTDVNMTAVGNVLIRSSTMIEPQYFQVGDKPESYACDYMESCEYSCFPEDKIEAPQEGAIITKPSSFMIQKMMDQIVAIIGRELALHFVVLEKMLGAPSKYNLYFALTELIENPMMTFADKYGRTGRLINRDKYYLFQPIEVTDKHSSVFDSMVPVQVKQEKIRLGISNVISEPMLMKAQVDMKSLDNVDNVAAVASVPTASPRSMNLQSINLQSSSPRPTEANIDARRIIAEIEMVVSRALAPSAEIEANDEDWYNHMNNYKAVPNKKKPKDFADNTAHKLLSKLHNIGEEQLTRYIWNHALNTLEYKDRISLAKWVFSDSHKTTDLETHIVDYFRYLVFTMEDITAIIIANNDDNVLFNLADWTEMPYKHETFDPVIKERFFVDPTKFPKIVGFFGGFKTGMPVFKIKQLMLKRNNPGAYLMNEAKGDIISILNSVLKYAHIEARYETELTTKMTKVALGIILEVIMQSITTRENVWYMRQEMANYNKIQKLKL